LDKNILNIFILIRKKYLQNLPSTYFYFFILKVLIITNRGDENVIGVIVIKKIIF